MAISLKDLSDRIAKLESSSSTGSGVTTLVNEKNGYMKWSNGLIIQWGTGTGSIKYPIPFPNAVFSVSSSSQHNAGWNEDTVINYITNTGFISHLAAYGTGYTVTCNWIAVGW